MTIEVGIYTKLAAAATDAGNRIYPVEAPQKATLPYIVWQRISASRDFTHSGPDGLAEPRFQFTCLAATPKAAKTLADQVRIALNGATSGFGSETVYYCLLDSDSDEPFTIIPGSENGFFGISLDFEIAHVEALT